MRRSGLNRPVRHFVVRNLSLSQMIFSAAVPIDLVVIGLLSGAVGLTIAAMGAHRNHA